MIVAPTGTPREFLTVTSTTMASEFIEEPVLLTDLTW